MENIWKWDNIRFDNRVNNFQKCVAVHTGYVVTENEGNMHMGQYYSR